MKNDRDYEQLSADWRHRDQLTWQLPSVLVAISGALITAVLELDGLAHVRNYILWGGLFFAGLLTISLGQNLYFQTVAEDLMDAIRSGKAVSGSSIPRRRQSGPTFGAFLKKGLLKAGSSGLLLLSAGLTGFLGFVISDYQFDSDTKFIWWVGTGIIVLGLTIFINFIIYTYDWQQLNPPQGQNDNQ